MIKRITKRSVKYGAVMLVTIIAAAAGQTVEHNYINTSLGASTVATTAPAPKLRPDKVSKNVDSVVVTVSGWETAAIKEYKIDNGEWSNYTGPITMTKNGVVYARSTDSANVKSPVASLKVNNLSQSPTGGDTAGTLSIIYVSPDATSSGKGTIDSPMVLTEAVLKLVPGGTIYMRGGRYAYSSQVNIEYSNNGTAEAVKNIIAYNGEKPVFDFSSQAYGNPSTVSNPRGLQLNGDYWHLKGLEFYGSADNGLYIGGNHNIIELCVADSNKDSGIQLGRRAADLPKEQGWPSYNLILNSTSFNNADPDNGEDADGFACKLTTGEGNVFDGCIAYNNVDDGWDLYTKTETGPIGSVTFRNCVSFNNGMTTNGTYTANSDGNGFKLGGTNIAVAHSLENSIAFNNKAHGFTDNSNPGTITLKNCTSYNNSRGSSGKKSNFDFARLTSSNNIFINLLSFNTGGVGSDKYRGIATNSVFYNSTKYYKFDAQATADSSVSASKGTVLTTGPSASDFASITVPSFTSTNVHEALRNSNGSVKLGDFFKVKDTSNFKGMGMDLGSK
jgi:hypothetical protein